MKDYHQAALEIEQSPLPDKWERAAELLALHLGAGRGEARTELKLLQEGKQLLKEGATERALVRFKAVNAPDLVRETYRQTGRDQEALDFFLRNHHLEEAGQYVREADGPNVSPAFLQSLLDKYLEANINYRLQAEAQVFIAGLLGRLLERENKEEWRPAVERFIDSFYFWGANLPGPILNFLLQARYYNGIFEVIREGTLYTKSPSPDLKKFIAELQRLADREKDSTLAACHQFYRNREAFETSLDRLELNGWNYRLFGASPRYYRPAVEFLLGEQKTDEAVLLARRHRDFRLAGQILEEKKYYAQAGRVYRDGGHLEDALRCYQAIGDEPGQARVYERLGRLEEALKIWERRGNSRDMARLRKKMNRGKTTGS
jgi:tetratricopeptide (TPR) repeat protein